MEIRVLGPLAVVEVDSAAAPAALGPAQRRLLAVLCVNAGQVVASDRIADTLGLKSNTVRTTVHRIRHSTGDLVKHEPPGYLIEPQNLDSHRFVELLNRARADSTETAIGWFDEALSLWRGSAYVEFATEEWALAEAVRLDELHATARADRIAVLMLHGRVTDAAADAEQLIHDQPLRERPRAQLMRALALQGRQTEALRVFQTYRTYLIDEVGVEPSAEVVELERQIAAGEIVAGSTTAVTPAVTGSADLAPAGTVTFLFTDIEGSTARWEEAPDEMNTALSQHDERLRGCIEDHGGLVFAHTGDGMCAAFNSAKAAIDAAIDAQRELELPVRIGLATGDADARDGNYFGPILNRTARIMAAAHAHQIIVAATTASMVDGVELRDLGHHRLRDVAETMGLFQVVAEGLPDRFPPLKTDNRAVGNLPTTTGELVGRDTEVQALTTLLETQRLVTLTGSGGVGKTSLALHVANQLAYEFPDGVWWVELANVRDGSGVPDTIAGTLGVTSNTDATVIESMTRAFAGRRALLVLDNCEHVLDAAANVTASLLGGARQLAIIATSREQLRIAGERVWAVPPLDFSGGDSPAVRLFVQRAREVGADFDAEAEIDAIVEICERLGGVAFAIELAAARMVSLSPPEIRDRLGDRFRLLGTPQRGLEHQQTLRQAVQWSYDLLDPDERTLLNRLAVFVDGFDVAGATSVGSLAEWDEYVVLDFVESLVRKSLLTTERVGGHVRYGMLETIRDFAQEELTKSGQLPVVQSRHAVYYRECAADYWQRWHGPEQRVALEWVEMELANLRAAFRATVDAGDIESASSLAAHTALLAQVLQQYEPISWIEEILERATAAKVSTLLSLYAGAGLGSIAGRASTAIRYGKMAADLGIEGDDPLAAAWLRFNTALAYRYDGQLDRWFEMCTELAEGEGFGQALGTVGMLTVPMPDDTIDDVRARGDRALALAHAQSNAYLVTYALGVYARWLARWEPVEALSMLREAYVTAQSARLSFWTATVAREIAGLEAAHGHAEQALEHFGTAFDSFQQMSNRGSGAMALAALSAALNRMGHPEAAATLYGAYTRHGNALPAYLPDGLHLPEAGEDLDTAIERGAQMDFDDAMQFARRQIQIARRELVNL